MKEIITQLASRLEYHKVNGKPDETRHFYYDEEEGKFIVEAGPYLLPSNVEELVDLGSIDIRLIPESEEDIVELARKMLKTGNLI